MKSQTSLVAQNTRLNEWAQQIRDCQNRPAGIKVDDWCQEHGITQATYYWRLRKVREALLEIADYSAPTEFVELQPSDQFSGNTISAPKTIAVLKGQNKLTLEITDQISESLFTSLLGAMIHAQ